MASAPLDVLIHEAAHLVLAEALMIPYGGLFLGNISMPGLVPAYGGLVSSPLLHRRLFLDDSDSHEELVLGLVTMAEAGFAIDTYASGVALEIAEARSAQDRQYYLNVLRELSIRGDELRKVVSAGKRIALGLAMDSGFKEICRAIAGELSSCPHGLVGRQEISEILARVDLSPGWNPLEYVARLYRCLIAP